MDSGIKKSHPDFGGRATCGINFVAGEACDDYNRHGTHVAGTVGGNTYGVAKGVSLIDVKVLDSEGGGALSSSYAGIEYVILQKESKPATPMVINMSLGGGVVIPQFITVIDEAVAKGIVVVVAAGNESSDACLATPAFVPSAITVGASDWGDYRADFSNFGDCVDLYAPGVDITSANYEDSGSLTIGGTSMAAPHVAGVAALYLEAHPTWTATQVWNAIRNQAIKRLNRTAFPLEIYFRNRRTTELLLQMQHI
jgi:subtilisin family serine protease